MNFEKIIQIIVSEPIYLSIVIIFSLAVIYSILKKFFKLLLLALVCLVGYVGYLIYTNQDLPGESDELIYPIIDTAKEKAKDIINELKLENLVT